MPSDLAYSIGPFGLIAAGAARRKALRPGKVEHGGRLAVGDEEGLSDVPAMPLGTA